MAKDNEEGIIDISTTLTPFSEDKTLTEYLNAENLIRFFKFCENPEIQYEVCTIFFKNSFVY